MSKKVEDVPSIEAGNKTATVWYVEALRKDIASNNALQEERNKQFNQKLDTLLLSNKKYGEDLEKIIDNRIEKHIGLTKTQQKANILIIVSSTVINIVLTLVNLNIGK